MMFNIGTTLKFEDFKKIKRYRRPLITGIFLQMILLPVLTLLVLSFTKIDPHYKFGIFILSICPGGSTSNFISYLIKSDVALSVLLTGINSFIILFTIPVLVSFGSSYFYQSEIILESTQLPFWDTVSSILFITFIPIVLGLLFRKYQASLTTLIEKPLKYISIIFLFLVFAIKIFAYNNEGEGSLGLMNNIDVLIPLLIVHFISLLISYKISSIILKNEKQSVTIGIEVGLQNAALALLVATVLIGNEIVGRPAIIYAGFSFFTTLIFGWWGMRRKILRNKKPV